MTTATVNTSKATGRVKQVMGAVIDVEFPESRRSPEFTLFEHPVARPVAPLEESFPVGVVLRGRHAAVAVAIHVRKEFLKAIIAV